MTVEEAMGRAIELAGLAARDGDIPVGAVVLDADGNVIGEGRNCRERDGDPLAHAEVMALRDAVSALRSAMNSCRPPALGMCHSSVSNNPSHSRAWNLAGCTLVVTLEPCPMCAGACLQTRVGRIVFGAWDAKLGACGSVWDIPRDPHAGHSAEVIGGVRENECAALLADFFSERRGN